LKPPKSLTDAQLQQYADQHLQYEIDMLVWSAGILAFLVAHKAEGDLPSAINNGLLNSFALHARNLISFLYSRSRALDHATDIVLEDYIGAADVPNCLPPIPPLLEQALTKANKQAAHLSMDRLQYEKAGKEWMFIELSRQILRAFASVVAHIPTSKMHDPLRQKLSRSDFRIPRVDIQIGRGPTGQPLSITFSLRISKDGKAIEGVSA
jgi:hypothetical protein